MGFIFTEARLPWASSIPDRASAVVKHCWGRHFPQRRSCCNICRVQGHIRCFFKHTEGCGITAVDRGCHVDHTHKRRNSLGTERQVSMATTPASLSLDHSVQNLCFLKAINLLGAMCGSAGCNIILVIKRSLVQIQGLAENEAFEAQLFQGLSDTAFSKMYINLDESFC